jgi:carbonic anhydrase/acetyltransferase-like protein (isoleucine patch superfamily)
MQPKAYRWRRGVRLEGLGDLARDAPIGNRPLAERQREAFAGQGFAIEDVDGPEQIRDREFLLFVDNLYVSPALLRSFLKALRRRAGTRPPCMQLALAEGPFTAFSQFAGEQATADVGAQRGYRYGLYACRTEAPVSPAVLEAAEPLLVDPGRRRLTLPFSSRLPPMRDLNVPVTDRVAFELTSWVHLWMANLSFIAVSFMGRVRSARGLAWLAWRVGLGVFGAFSLRPFSIALSILARCVVRGRGCRIHPSAVVEASILGRGVDIGPQCVVRGSILGDRVRVLEQSVVDGSVLGDDVLVNPQGLVKVTVAYPRAVFNWIQAGVVGEGAFLSTLCRPLDMKMQGEVRVRHRGRLVGTGLSFLGCCIGHRSFVSADSVIAPGRLIPNDHRIVSDDSRHIRDVPEGLPVDDLLVDRDGIVQPLRPAQVSAPAATARASGTPPPAGAAPAPPAPRATPPATAASHRERPGR